MSEVIRSLKAYSKPEDPRQNPFQLLPTVRVMPKTAPPEIVVEGVPPIPQKPPTPRNET
jgi:hypothetical protein